MCSTKCSMFFFFNDPPPPEIYTLSLHDALPISTAWQSWVLLENMSAWHNQEFATHANGMGGPQARLNFNRDRKSTRLNSSHSQISYAVFCLKKKKTKL